MGRHGEGARGRPSSKLKPPTLLFPDTLIFDDGTHRVELHHFGTAHTKGDGVAWLPKETIVFTGDAVVNGPYNFVGDGDVGRVDRDAEQSVRASAPRRSGRATARSAGVGDQDQQTFFRELRRVVRRRARRRRRGAGGDSVDAGAS